MQDDKAGYGSQSRRLCVEADHNLLLPGEAWQAAINKKEVTKTYWQYKSWQVELSVAQSILLRGSRIIIPSSMWIEILNKIHDRDRAGLFKAGLK